MCRLLPLWLVLALPLPIWSAAPPPVAYRPWTPDDVVDQETVGEVTISPDGRFIVWARTTVDKEKDAYVTQLFRHDRTTGRRVQLTRGTESCTTPRWSPDGAYLAFLSSRPAPKEKGDEGKSPPHRRSIAGRRLGAKGGKGDEESKTQIWILDATGGEPWALTDGPRSVAHLEWAGKGALLFVAQEDADRRESALKERKDATRVVEDERNEPPARLFRVEVESKKVRRLTANRDRIEHLAVSPDGRYAVTGHSRSLRYLYDNKVKPIFYLRDLKAEEASRVLEDATLNVSHVIWSTDGKGFYATNERSLKPALNQAGVTELLYHDLGAKKAARLDLDWPRGLSAQEDNGHAAGVVPFGTGFLALLADGIRCRLAVYSRDGAKWKRSWVSGEHAAGVYGFASVGGIVAYSHSTASSPPEWHHAVLRDGMLTRSVTFAPADAALAARRKARMEVVRWKGARGDTVDGLLFYPHGWTPGKPAPLVVQIHGGPASADHVNWDESWAYNANLVCQRGAFVLRPNYHGSTGYGLDWLESIADGRYCDLEADDIEKGVDALIARGLVDEKRLGLTGWSNGAILTNVLITKTTRYRAAVAGSGSAEYISDWSSCEFGDAFNRFYFGKTPLEDVGLYLRKSPFYRLDKVRTPTLILFGTEDRVVHPQQGWAMYRGLQQLGKAPVRFVQFPDEKHSLRKPSHRKRKLEEEMAWLDRHLFGKTPAEEPKLVKPDSPLAWLIARQKARRSGRLYGVLEKGILVPETVPHGKIVLGRFEVTRAQYARFDESYKVESGTENHPANGIGFDRAKAYCAWLSGRTGRRYRLPTEAEAEAIYEKPEEGDNTLDHWAGYAVNPDDAARLRAELATLSGRAPLLREVGAGRGKGDEAVFDLSGNVAEWVVGKDGKGLLRGGSADGPADTRGKTPTAGEAYRGLRVVRE